MDYGDFPDQEPNRHLQLQLVTSGFPFHMLVTAIGTAFWPRVAAATTLKGNKDLLRRAMLLTIVTVIGALFYAVFAPLLMPFVFGAGYASGILVAQLLCLGWCIYLFTVPFGLVGYNFGVVRISWLINVVVLIIIIAINVWLLPIIGPLAAASAFVISTAFSAACQRDLRLEQDEAVCRARRSSGLVLQKCEFGCNQIMLIV